MREVINLLIFMLLVFGAGWDVKKREIPVILIGIIGVMIVPGMLKEGLMWSKIGGTVIGGFFLVISRLTKEAIGYGDSWIILLLGIHLGIWDVLILLLWASVLAGVCSLFFLWLKKWKRTASIPFVPFIAIGYLGVILT